jgi:hypothetical protein
MDIPCTNETSLLAAPWTSCLFFLNVANIEII